jgi:multidrug efflux pump subunit AcrB
MEQNQTGISAFAIRRPYFIIVLTLAVITLGILSIASLPKDLLPVSNAPAVQILSIYNGMPVQDVQMNLSERFERYTGQAIGIIKQDAKSLVGVSIVRNFFGEGSDLNTAISQTTSLVLSVLRRLPPGTQPPLILPFDPLSSQPLALIAAGTKSDQKDLYDTARYDVRNSIQAIPGAMAPTVMGGSMREAIVYIDPKKSMEYDLSPTDVINRLTKLNSFVPAGDVKIGDKDYQILSNALADKIESMNDFPLRGQNGVTVYVKDIGKAEDSKQVQTNVVLIDGTEQVYVPIYRQPGANSLEVVDSARKVLDRLSHRLKDFTFSLVGDQTSFIRESIRTITDEALIGGGLAILTVLLFLGNPRATFGIFIALPISLLFPFIGFKLTGQTINAMTMGGIAISIGVVVDNSIVVLENISRRLGEKLSPMEAAMEGGSEIAMPVLASTLSTIIVLFPVLILSGIVKVLFAALAKSVIFIMVGSYLAAMALMPLYASKFMKSDEERKPLPRILVWTKSFMDKIVVLYESALKGTLRHSWWLLGLIILLLAGAAATAPFLGTELFPRADSGGMILDLRLSSGTRIEETTKFAKELDSKLRQWIEPHDLRMVIANAGVYYGFPAAFTPNVGTQDVFLDVELTADRNHSSQFYAKLIRQKMQKEYPSVDMGIELGGLLSSAIGGGLRSPIDIQIQGPDFSRAVAYANQLVAPLKKLRGAVDVRVQQRLDAPAIALKVSRDKAINYGLSVDDVIKNVASAVSGSSTFDPAIWVDPKSGIDYFFGVQLHQILVSSKDDLADLPIRSQGNVHAVPLKNMAEITETTAPTEMDEVDLRSVVDIYMGAQERDIGGLSKDVQKVIDDQHLPPEYETTIQGEISEMKKSVGALGGGFLLSTFLVYLVLVAQFESFAVPIVILSSVPLGAIGIVLILFATRTYFSIQAAIGAIFMIGIAVSNGVLLVEFMQTKFKESGDLDAAIILGAKTRVRPILMTAIASICGLTPMAIGIGRGSEANIPLGRAIIGGQITSTLLTLFVVPPLYRFVAGFAARRKNKTA